MYSNNFQAVKLNTYIAASVVMYIVYPNMVMQLLGSVHCFKALADEPGDIVLMRLRNHPDIFCSDADYQWYRGVVFVPAVIVWVIAFPVFVVFSFFDRKIPVYNTQQTDRPDDAKELLQAQTVKAQYGFLYVGLKVELPTKLTKEQEEVQLEIRQVEEDFEKTNPSFWNRFLHWLSKAPSVSKVAWTILRGNGLDIEPKPTLSVMSFFYWEVVVYFGKLCMIIVAVAFSDINANIQTNLTLAIVAVLLFVQIRSRPYDRESLNSMHAALLLTILVVTYTRSVLKGIRISYSEWQQKQMAKGLNPVSEAEGIV